MLLSRKIIVVLIGGLFMLLSGEAQAQCLNPAWSISDAPFAVNDVVSNDGKDWICINAGQGHWEPSGGAGHFGWNELSDPCASISEPILGTTTVEGEWCRTAFANAEVTGTGGATITQRGVVFSQLSSPDITDSVVVDDFTTTGTYQDLLEDLAPETTYYVRGYATNSEGTGYGTETSFTTMADVDCHDCTLACDKSDPTLLDPATWPGIITMEDTLCVTADITMADNVIVRGMVKMCNDAQVTLSGSITMQGEVSGFEGQIVYEGCNEKFIGTGSYTGYVTVADALVNDEQQMVSYCGTCNNADTSQFLDRRLTIAFWGAGCRPTSSFLPVELTSFSANKIDEQAVLVWNTASEINNSHFEVQVSMDGVTWETIGIVQGAGNSSTSNSYSFIDPETRYGVQYYRLKQVDYDNSSTRSTVKVLTFTDGEVPSYILAYDNGENQIKVDMGINGMGEVLLLDSRGRLIAQQSFMSVNKKGTQVYFNKSNLSTGMYFIKMVSGNQILSQKIAIRK